MLCVAALSTVPWRHPDAGHLKISITRGSTPTGVLVDSWRYVKAHPDAVTRHIFALQLSAVEEKLGLCVKELWGQGPSTAWWASQPWVWLEGPEGPWGSYQ